MTTAKRQLSAFYVEQGLTGKHLRSAIKHDLKLVKQNVIGCFGYDQRLRPLGPHEDRQLSCLFVWFDSPEGYDYWADRGAR